MGVELEYGEVSAVDYQSCQIRVRLDDRDGVESYWLHVPQRNTQGTQRRPLMPELNEQVAVLLDADGVGGVYLGGVYSTAEPPPVVDEDTDYVRFTACSFNVSSPTIRPRSCAAFYFPSPRHAAAWCHSIIRPCRSGTTALRAVTANSTMGAANGLSTRIK